MSSCTKAICDSLFTSITQLDEEVAQTDSEIQSETGNDIDIAEGDSKIEKRDWVPREWEMHYIKLVSKPLPQIDTRSEATVTAMHESAPWIFARNEFGENAARRDEVFDEEGPFVDGSLDVKGRKK